MKKIITAVMVLTATAFHLNAQVADSSKREVKLQGAVNFRDIGGYPAKSGKHVKWGKLYRSGDLSRLSASDIEKLQQLSIAYVADFRGPNEVSKAPDKLPVTATRVSLPAGSEHTGDSSYMKQMFASARDSGLVPFYADIHALGDRYKPLFEEMLQVNPDSAILFHCTAGKDRTGIAASLILYALNVDEKKIMDDYLATDYYRRTENERSIKGMAAMYKLDEATARNLMGTKPDYLNATYASIKKEYGNVDNYLEKVMGLTAQKRAALQKKFLE